LDEHVACVGDPLGHVCESVPFRASARLVPLLDRVQRFSEKQGGCEPEKAIDGRGYWTIRLEYPPLVGDSRMHEMQTNFCQLNGFEILPRRQGIADCRGRATVGVVSRFKFRLGRHQAITIRISAENEEENGGHSV
jgi:hypothetical protein